MIIDELVQTIRTTKLPQLIGQLEETRTKDPDFYTSLEQFFIAASKYPLP